MSDGSNEGPNSGAGGESTQEEKNSESAGFLLTIGDIGVTSDMIVTPNGDAPLADSQWIVTDMTRTESRIPAWAIVLAILFSFACLIGLFFLLVKEYWTSGYVEVSVRSGRLYHKTQIPVSDISQVQYTRMLVSHVQSLVAQAGRTAN